MTNEYPPPADGHPVHATPADGYPAQTTPADGHPVHATPADGYPVYAAPADGHPVYPPPADGYPVYPPPAGGYPVYAAPADGQSVYAGQPYPPPPMYPVYPPRPVNTRPGTMLAAGVLGFVQAGITGVPTFMLTLVLSSVQAVNPGAQLGLLWGAVVAQFVAFGLLIAGSVQMVAGTSRVMYLVAVTMEILLSVYWAVCMGLLFEDTSRVWSVLVGNQEIVFAVFYAVMPVIGLALAASSGPGEYVAARRSR
jgi:hypothetical protein